MTDKMEQTSEDRLLGALARGYCKETTKDLAVDATLIKAIAIFNQDRSAK